MDGKDNIIIKGARVNNLKNIDVVIPRGKLTVITGISGSGKSSLAFDTLFAEGQRRFAESLSSYARQFLGRMAKPDVDAVDGIPPAIAIEQKVNSRNPRSTVGTSTEIYDLLRTVYAKIGRTFSPVSGKEVRRENISDVASYICSSPGTYYILADFGWKDKERRVELLLSLKEEGFSRLLRDGSLSRIDEVLSDDDALSGEEVYLLVDRIRAVSPGAASDDELRDRIYDSARTAYEKGDGRMKVARDDGGSLVYKDFSNRFEADGIRFEEPSELLFSFNNPIGACPECGGFGKVEGIDEDLVIPDKSLSVYEGAVVCWRGEVMKYFYDNCIMNAGSYGLPIHTPYSGLTPAQKRVLWKGEGELIGIDGFFKWVESNRYKIQYRYMLSRFTGRTVCPQCEGSRLRKEALYVRVAGKNIHEMMSMSIGDLYDFLSRAEFDEYETKVAGKAIQEIRQRLSYIIKVGLSYLTLERLSNTLSGGESQRINLVSALGSSLVGSLYVLDEPSIGLHPRDTMKLISVLKDLRDLGNTVVVVEHDREIIEAADCLIDMGPLAGTGGGKIMYAGPIPDTYPEGTGSLTLQFLFGKMKVASDREKRVWSESLKLSGVSHHNLKNVSVDIPLGVMTAVTGVSGSGKSSLVGEVLYPALMRHFNRVAEKPGTFKELGGDLASITSVEYIDQNPIGKSSRSNAVTYLKIYDDIRKLYAAQKYARMNGFTPSFFSFNGGDGRCPECLGEGVVRIGMQFMADVTMVCESCGGKRFKPEILEVKYKDKAINEILDMSVAEAIAFFSDSNDPLSLRIAKRLQPLVDVGLSYIRLGQSSSTLSGGESQRVKLAAFLADGGYSSDEVITRAGSREEHILFIFDEPTTGLHFYDVGKLLKSFDALMSKGHTILVVEHNLDVIAAADWVIDLGPDGGDEGGEVVFEGSPEDLRRRTDLYTGAALSGMQAL